MVCPEQCAKSSAQVSLRHKCNRPPCTPHAHPVQHNGFAQVLSRQKVVLSKASVPAGGFAAAWGPVALAPPADPAISHLLGHLTCRPQSVRSYLVRARLTCFSDVDGHYQHDCGGLTVPRTAAIDKRVPADADDRPLALPTFLIGTDGLAAGFSPTRSAKGSCTPPSFLYDLQKCHRSSPRSGLPSPSAGRQEQIDLLASFGWCL